MPTIKICGQTSWEDADLSVRSGATWLGFIFYPKSKRAVVFDHIRPWLETLSGRALRVGVFVDESLPEILRIVSSGAIDAVQLHGRETLADCETLRKEGVRVIKALRVEDEASLAPLTSIEQSEWLLDGPDPGSGRPFDHQLAAKSVRQYPESRFLLAGGLTAETVGSAIHHVRPDGVDVASGVEMLNRPGIKDPERLASFICEAQRAFAIRDTPPV